MPVVQVRAMHMLMLHGLMRVLVRVPAGSRRRDLIGMLMLVMAVVVAMPVMVGHSRMRVGQIATPISPTATTCVSKTHDATPAPLLFAALDVRLGGWGETFSILDGEVQASIARYGGRIDRISEFLAQHRSSDF